MISAGFLLVVPVEGVVSASKCICPRFPPTEAIEWCSNSFEESVRALAEVGVPPHLHREAVTWATESFEQAFGWQGVFYTLDAAREARNRFQISHAKVIALGLPEAFVDKFIENAAPAPASPGFSPNGVSGFFDCARRREPLPPGGRALGFEPLELDFAVLTHSSGCVGPPSEHRLLATEEEAIRYCEESGAKWYPFVLVEY